MCGFLSKWIVKYQGNIYLKAYCAATQQQLAQQFLRLFRLVECLWHRTTLNHFSLVDVL